MEHKLIQSYVLDKYFVSTAYRQSSAPIIDSPWYYETIVWEWDPKTKKRGKIIDMQDSTSNPEIALARHFALISGLTKDFET